MIAASRDTEARCNPHPPPINCPAFSGMPEHLPGLDGETWPQGLSWDTMGFEYSQPTDYA